LSRVVVVGSTSWGTTLAVLLARNGHDLTLWTRTQEEASALQTSRTSWRRPELSFAASKLVNADVAGIGGGDVVRLAVPSGSLRANLERVAPFIHPDATVVSAVKGIEPETGLRMSELIAAAGVAPERVLALSGPNFAPEIASGLPAATVVAGPDAPAREAQKLLNSPLFRVYTSDDIAGVEVGGALKNVVAIACGLCDGLGYGANARAALITRALAEITRLGVAAGARPMTFLGLAGMGDLILTCQSDISRNRRLGLALAAGMTLEAASASVHGVVEGAVTARSIPNLARKYGVEMPVCAGLHAVLYQDLKPTDAVRELMAREMKAEW
jgi:glycerol-3-phosphate dehydrogenase (NAD(P)+)